MRFAPVLFLAFAAAEDAVKRTVLYDRKIVPPTWHQVARASTAQRMHFVVAVKQQNTAQLEKKFWAVADPESKAWRQHMAVDEINQMVKSSVADMATVTTWLRAGLSKDSQLVKTTDSIEVKCSVADAEKLFNTEINIFAHDHGHSVLRSFGEHSVPTTVRAAIDLVEGIADFPMRRASAKKVPKKTDKDRRLQFGGANVAPPSLIEMYKVPKAAVSTVSFGPAEFQDATSYNKQDLQTFFAQTDISPETITDTVGPFDGTSPGVEPTLDVQYITSIGQKQVNWYWTAENWMYTWSNKFFNTKAVPDMVSISWGWAEDQQCASGISASQCQTLGIDSEQYVKRVNVEFMKIGLRGVSLIVASGDSGANGRSDPECSDPKLHASFPAASPYVTAVGATMLTNPVFNLKNPPPVCSSNGPCASGGTEVAVGVNQAGFTSGGGFSTYGAMPAYQKEAVATYLKNEKALLPPKTMYNASNRAYPDVAAMGSNFLIYMADQGGWTTVGGTSASTPTFSGVMSHLNDMSYKHSGKPMGFLNPFLYKMHAEAPLAFTDVTSGNNKCTESYCGAQCQGYTATKGWDPVSGLGTPVTTEMLAYLEKILGQSAGRQEITV